MFDMTPMSSLIVGLLFGVSLTYLLMRKREELAAGSALTFKSAWDQLSKDHQASLEILKSAADVANSSANGVMGVAGAMTSSIAEVLLTHGEVINRDYGGQALQLVRELLNKQHLQQVEPVMKAVKEKAEMEARQALRDFTQDPTFVREHDAPIPLRDTLNPTSI